MRHRLIAVLIIAAAAILLPAAAAGAHPLGNFTVNTYSGLRVEPDHVRVDFVVDMAEIPALQTTQQIGHEADGRSSTEKRRTYQQDECRRLGDGLRLRLDGTPLGLDVTATGLDFPPGQAGLDTLRLTCSFQAATGGRSLSDATLAFGSDNFTDRIGWRERPLLCCGTLSRYMASVGTSVRDRTYEVSMAKTTASASGTKR